MYAMLGEGARRSLEDPAFRKSSRKHMAPGFSREALRGYISKVRGALGFSREALRGYMSKVRGGSRV